MATYLPSFLQIFFFWDSELWSLLLWDKCFLHRVIFKALDSLIRNPHQANQEEREHVSFSWQAQPRTLRTEVSTLSVKD